MHLYIELEKKLKERRQKTKKRRGGREGQMLPPNIIQFFPFSSYSMSDFVHHLTH